MTLRAGIAVLATSIVVALSVGLRAETVDRAIATPIEQALIEQACSTPPVVAVDPDKHEECLHAKLDSLRADFGRDLSRLSVAERRGIDSACEQIRGTQGREGYLDCVGRQLAVIQSRRNRARDVTSGTPAAAVSSLAAPALTTASSGRDVGRSSARTWLFVSLATVLCAAVVALMVIRARRSPRVCQVCRAQVESAGNMCPTCRHEAAVALRRASADRAERQLAQEDQERLQRERDDEERQRMGREAEEAQLRQQELTRRSEEADQQVEDETQRRHAEAAQRQGEAFTDETQVAFDPYAILGVPRDASFDAIHAAYVQGKSKYDLEQVADLGMEITQHYMAKAQAVDRAFQTLAESHGRTLAALSKDAPADQVDGAPAV